MTTLVQVAVRALRVDADIGIHAHEIGVPQTLVVDVVLDIEAPRGDGIGETVDYARIAAAAAALGRRRLHLIETFAAELGRHCVAALGAIRASVVVAKPAALANGRAEVRVVVARDADLSRGAAAASDRG